MKHKDEQRNSYESKQGRPSHGFNETLVDGEGFSLRGSHSEGRLIKTKQFIDDIYEMKSRIKILNNTVVEHENWLQILINILSCGNNADYVTPIQKVKILKL